MTDCEKQWGSRAPDFMLYLYGGSIRFYKRGGWHLEAAGLALWDTRWVLQYRYKKGSSEYSLLKLRSTSARCELYKPPNVPEVWFQSPVIENVSTVGWVLKKKWSGGFFPLRQAHHYVIPTRNMPAWILCYPVTDKASRGTEKYIGSVGDRGPPNVVCCNFP